jgi:phosphoribosylformylglycinamidine (FGAM) synthase PurS component
VQDMCDRFLTNPVIEEAEIALTPAATAAAVD